MKALIIFMLVGLCIHGGVTMAEVDEPLTICELQMNENARALIRPCASRTSRNRCSGGGDWVAFDIQNIPGGSYMYSTALAAFLAKKPILVRISEVSGHCVANYDKISRLRIRN